MENKTDEIKTEGDAPLKLRILVVDDSSDFVEPLAFYFRAKGHEVTNALNGKEALRMLFKGGFDCVVVDLLMPVMGGDVLLYYISKYPELCELSFIILTSLREDDFLYRPYRQEAFQIKKGGVKFMRKPGDHGMMLKIFENETKETLKRLHRLPGDYPPLEIDY